MANLRSILIALTLLAGPSQIPGDLNSDGHLNAIDVQAVINAALGVSNVTTGDMNGDGQVDAVDVQIIINGVLGQDITDLLPSHEPDPPTPAANVILFIGDGMGLEHVKAAGMYAHGAAGTLAFEALPYQTNMTTHSANSAFTDSAAAATAMATGVKVNNGVLSLRIPGDQSELVTSLELLRDVGKATGLVTTSVINHATPAAFAAHEPSRNNYSEITDDYLYQTRPDLLFGGGGISTDQADQANYLFISNRDQLLALDTETTDRVVGRFASGHLPYEYDGLGDAPHLSQMTQVALDILDNNPDGFFLMVEGARIDHAAHANDIARDVMETLEFDHAVQVALDWAQEREDTLIIVTADHETGGMIVIRNEGQGEFPTVYWSSTRHSATAVPVYAWGHIADFLPNGTIDNTDIFGLCTTGLPISSADHASMSARTAD